MLFSAATVISAPPVITPLSLWSPYASSTMDDMEVDNAPTSTKTGKEKDNGKKRFEVKKVSIRHRGVISNDPHEISVERSLSLGMGCHFLHSTICLAV